jgi:hypothetical protein
LLVYNFSWPERPESIREGRRFDPILSTRPSHIRDGFLFFIAFPGCRVSHP